MILEHSWVILCHSFKYSALQIIEPERQCCSASWSRGEWSLWCVGPEPRAPTQPGFFAFAPVSRGHSFGAGHCCWRWWLIHQAMISYSAAANQERGSFVIVQGISSRTQPAIPLPRLARSSPRSLRKIKTELILLKKNVYSCTIRCVFYSLSL